MNDFKYEVDKNQVTITRYRGTDEDVVIPDEIDGRPVTIIGAYAFRECFRLTSITLPNSITTIGDWAFARCHSLTSVTMPDGCSIGEDAFEDCPAVITIRKKEMSKEHILYEGDKHWVLKPKAMSEEPKTSAERFNEISQLIMLRLGYCPPGETMSVDAPKCPSCGVAYRDHLGLIGTCEKLQKIFALVESHRTEQHYRKSHADLRLWEAVLGLKGGPPDLKEAVG